MRSVILLIGWLFLFTGNAFALCKPAEAQGGKTVTGCLQVGDQARRYRVFVPRKLHTAGKPVPLVLGFHGGGGSAKRFERYSHLSALAGRRGDFIAVYPEGLHKHWNDGRPQVNNAVDDVAFIAQLLRHLNEVVLPSTAINGAYLVGMSNGGLMVMRLLCERPGLFSGVAVVAAAMTDQLMRHCEGAESAASVLLIYGDRDSAFLDDGRLVNPVRPRQVRGHHVGFVRTQDYWAEVNGCSGSPRVSSVDRVATDSTRLQIRHYRGCRAPVQSVQIEGGGHRWPGVDAPNGRLLVKRLNLGRASHELDAGKVIVRAFFNGKSD